MATAPPIPEELWNQLPAAAQAAVSAVIAALEARIAALEAQINQSSSNSSKPPSSDPPHLKPAPPRPATGRRKGGQPGHPRRTRPALPPDEVIELRADTCTHCRAPLRGDDPRPLIHQVIEIPRSAPASPSTGGTGSRARDAGGRAARRCPRPWGAGSGFGSRPCARC